MRSNFVALALALAACNTSSSPPASTAPVSSASAVASAATPPDAAAPDTASTIAPPTDAALAGAKPAGIAIDKLDADLHAVLAKQAGNMIYSAASIEAALAMTSAGAKGTTAAEMAKTLHLPNDPTQAANEFSALLAAWAQTDANGPTLAVANRLWVQQGYPFAGSFLAITHDKYFADAKPLDFAKGASSAQTINAWVSDATHGKITDLISPRALTPDTRIVLTNAVYFKAKWQRPFEKQATSDAPFTRDDASKVKVPMMHSMSYESLADIGNAQVLDLPYQGSGAREMTFTIVLPKTGTPLSAVENGLTAEKLASYTKQEKQGEVRVTLPKFKATQSIALADPLRALGMTTAFEAGKADFSGMTTKEGLFISAVIHKAFIQVDEEGTEAAAATAVMAAGAGMPTNVVDFVADHPFLFFVRDKSTGAVLFSGRLSDPSAS